ncbi:AI-2E family transporter [Shinella daejeonensis]|uniref:AI-2E family transporter n=1 Tax=Shinella daejeonensis TaxID=659017 RepID=UPI0020C809BD|nr:AI-2E family transporter [Shinella daejeonensis]MCP8894921.1 AI-2E family transporter [Shinella daejeonensis]
MRAIEDHAFLWLLVGTSIAFGLIVWPYFGAVLWGVVAAIVFAPLYRHLFRLTGQRAGLAASITVLLVILLVIVPLMLIASSLVIEATSLYNSLQSGKLDANRYFREVGDMLPDWLRGLLDRLDLMNLDAVRDRLSQLFSQFLQMLASRAVTVGQSTFEFIVALGVMLYLTFFLLRDGSSLTRRIKDAIPLRASQRDALLEKFTVVVRATVKGSVFVAALQGALGGLIFWLLGINAPVLWAVVMAFFALLPAVGASIVWLPVAIYLLVSGAVWKAIVLIAFGMLVIGLVDNLLRPVLVGKSTKMPDYLVLISTLGGISAAGLNGFVIGPIIAAMFIAVWDIFTATRGAAEPGPSAD